MHVLLVHNEDAGSASKVDPAAVLEANGCTVEQASLGDALRWTRENDHAHLGHIERVVVAGGDGSIGCAGRLAWRLEVPLGVVPAGTANDFARAMGLPTLLEDACVLAGTGSTLRAVDLGDVDGTPFVNVASIGIAPAAAEHAGRLKRGLRSLSYPVGAALAAVQADPVSVVAHVDGSAAWSGDAWQVIIASTGAFGGWADTGLTHDGDGKLDLVIVPADRDRRDLAVDAAALMRGELADRNGVVHVRGARIEVVLRRAPKIVVDGELVDVPDRHIVASVSERPLDVVVTD